MRKEPAVENSGVANYARLKLSDRAEPSTVSRHVYLQLANEVAKSPRFEKSYCPQWWTSNKRDKHTKRAR